MKIELITMWYNEEFLAPFLFNHYSWVDKIHVLLTPVPNDRTETIAKRYPNVEIEYFRFPDDKIDDILKINKFNDKYKSLTEADYVILVDSDEFIFCDKLNQPVRNHLEATMKDIYFVNFWQVYKHEQDLPLDSKIPVFHQRRHGDANMLAPFNILYVKPVVVKGRLDIAWTPGNHELIYKGKGLCWRTRNIDDLAEMNVSTTKGEMLQGAHWRLVDLDETIKRRIGNRKNRISQNNLSKGMGYQHFKITEEEIVREYNDHKNDPEVIMDDGIPCWQPVKETIKECNGNTFMNASGAVNCNNPLKQNKQSSYYGFARPEVVAAIIKYKLPTGKVLEIGCAGGATGKNLKDRLPVQSYVGIEVSREAADIANKHLDRVIVADIEKTDLADEHGLKPGEFDLLLALDVLEHLYDPWSVLAKLSCYIKPGGYVVASIPNIQNIAIVQDLIKGNWQYQDAGILDATHLRFFTFETSNKMFSGAGLTIENVEYVMNPPLDMDKLKESGNIYRQGNLEITNLTKNEFLQLFTYQYILIAKKTPSLGTLNAPFVKTAASDMNPRTTCGHLRRSVEKLTSIIILTFNELKYTKVCVESICKNTPEPHEIIFVDNASKDGTVKWLKELAGKNSNYRLIENKTNLGFAKGCNQGIETSRGEYILLLNNDVVVTKGWLSGMLECLKSAPDFGIIGPMTNNISGNQKLATVGYTAISGLDDYAARFRKQNHHRRIPARRVVGFCMMFKRTMVDRIGLLDESFGTGNFEDDDYCLRAVLAGYRNTIAGDVFIHHHGSRSFIGNKINYGSAMGRNRKLFDEKWRLDARTEEGRRLVALHFIEKAADLNEKGRIDDAIASFVEGTKYAPDDASIHQSLALMLIDAKLFQDAIDALNSMPKHAQQQAASMELFGSCFEGLGRFDEANAYAERLLAITPSSAPAMNLKGMLAYKKGDRAAAERFFQQSSEADPGYGEPFTNLGVMQWAVDKKQEALDLLERGFLLSPTMTDCVTLYHNAVTSLEAFSRAEPIFREAKALHPMNKRVLFLFIDILLQQGKYNEAMKEVEAALLVFDIDDGIIPAALQIREKIGAWHLPEPPVKRGTLSLCMIVKNEEAHLAKCLMSVRDIADEMIVVDTGSTDKTKDIATAFGAQVFDFTWTNDFSEARNFSLSKASGNWVLVLDGDEVLSLSDHAALAAIVHSKPGKPVAYSIVTRNYTNKVSAQGWTANDGHYTREEAGRGWHPSTKVRLFPNDKRIQFRNAVHEVVEPSLGEAGIGNKPCGIPVHHYGKMNAGKTASKGEDYYLLGRKKLEETGGDAKAIQELAVQASELKRYSESVELWLKVIAMQPGNALAYFNMGYAHLMLKQYEETLRASKKALELNPDLKEAVLNYASSELVIGDIDAAITSLDNVLKRVPDYPPALGLLAASLYMKGDREKALGYFNKLNKMAYNCVEFLYDLADMLSSEGRYKEAIQLLEAAIESNNTHKDTQDLLVRCREKMGKA